MNAGYYPGNTTNISLKREILGNKTCFDENMCSGNGIKTVVIKHNSTFLTISVSV